MASNVARTGLAQDLAEHALKNAPIRIGLIGCGEMGTDIVTCARVMDGMDVVAIADIRPHIAVHAVEMAYQDKEHWQIVKTTDALNLAIESKKVAIIDDAKKLLESGLIDVVIEATGLPGIGAELGILAMERGKHLVMMNVEADVTIGSYLKYQADKLGVVYTLGAGDEPSSCMELIAFVSAMGHTIVSAGKGKNNPLNFDATPDMYKQQAMSRHMNPRMLVEFIDGSKTMIEMAAIANATGLLPDTPGMHGPSATADQLSSVLIPKQDGGVLSGVGRVDYSIGNGLAPGVFVVAKMAHPRIQQRMQDLKMGKGPYFTFIRPYHLTSIEVPLSCARAVLHKKADMVALSKPVAEVCAVAKRDLQTGERLDQIGEYCYRAWIMEAQEAKSKQAVPCGLLAGATVVHPIKKGALLTYQSVRPDTSSKIVKLRNLQDRMISQTTI